MTDSLTPNLKLTIQTPGGNSNSWGTIENTNKEEIDDKLGDVTSVSTTGGTTTLTDAQEIVNALTISGTLVSNATIVFSGRGGTWVVKNATSGAFTVTCKVTGQSGVTVTQGDTRIVYCNGTDIAYATGSTDLVNDTSPQLGGDLDANGFDILLDHASAIRDENDNEQIVFGREASAVNYVQVFNRATGGAPNLAARGDDTNVDLALEGKGTGGVVANFKNATGLGVLDSDSSHALKITTSSNLSAQRTLTLIPGDGNRSVTLAGDLNVSGAAEISGTHTGTHSGTSSGTNTGDQTVPSAASQAQQEAASATNVHTSPGTQHFHPGHPKCWGYATVAGGAPTLQASYNLTSITDDGTGLLTATIATDFSSANWAPGVDVGTSSDFFANFIASAVAAGSIQFSAHDGGTGSGADDPDAWSFWGFGDHA